MSFERWRHYARGWLFHFFGKEDQAFAEYVKAFQHDRQDVQSARHLAFIAVGRGDYEAALDWFGAALRIAPTDAATHFNHGYALREMGRCTDAVAAFAAAVRLDPCLDRAWYGLGLANAALGCHGEAIAAFAETVKLQPMNGDGYYQLAMAYHHDSQPEKTRETIVKLIGFDPKMARQLILDSGHADLATQLPKLPF
jgi:tetratricopeptide (TPR) repeat protein